MALKNGDRVSTLNNVIKISTSYEHTNIYMLYDMLMPLTPHRITVRRYVRVGRTTAIGNGLQCLITGPQSYIQYSLMIVC